MAEPLRQQILTAVINRLRTIRPGNVVTMFDGAQYRYTLDIAANVFSMKSTPMEKIAIPGVNVSWKQHSTFVAVREHQHELIIVLEILASGEEELTLLIAEITACIGQDLTWGGLAVDTTPVGDEDIAIAQKTHALAGCRTSFIITYNTNPWNPWA